MAVTKKKARLLLKRSSNFFKIFLRNSKGVVGIFIILVFVVFSFAPQLFTPYDPVLSAALAGDRAAPSWLRYVPPMLGGIPDLSENMRIINDADFTMDQSYHALNDTHGEFGEWTVEWVTSGTENIHIERDSVGSPFSGPGSLRVSYSRSETESPCGNVTLMIYKDFDYPFSGPPRKFVGAIAYIVNGSVTERTVTESFLNKTTWSTEIRTYNVSFFDVPVNFKVFIERIDFMMWEVWPNPSFTPLGVTSDGTAVRYIGEWSSSRKFAPIDSDAVGVSTYLTFRYGGTSAIRITFPSQQLPGRYRWGIKITFQDLENTGKLVETVMNIDDFAFDLRGTCWGLLGTDQYGRDLFTQLVYGARLSLYVGLLSAVFGVVIGLVVGLMAGYLGKFVDEIIMRFTDMLLVIPSLPLLIVLVAVLGPKLENLIILLGILGWMGFARLVRSQVLSLKERPFIEAAKAVGAGRVHILSKHILPNVMSLVYVTLATSVPGAVTAEAALSWLGFADPFRISWGKMLYDVQVESAWGNWWWVIPPGLCIALLAMAFILLGYALDDVLNPKLRVRR
jgi:peptide/nickel transport system permease protein